MNAPQGAADGIDRLPPAIGSQRKGDPMRKIAQTAGRDQLVEMDGEQYSEAVGA